ncbi:MAG: hypothetical protein JXA97_04665 [Anaerolineales bacterium]|nr:hypothetical protein [Anaerolineales bacterium]
MGRDTWRYKQLDEEREQRGKLNPIWRGVGCMLAVVLGMISFFFARWFLAQNLIYIPPEIRVLSFAPWLPKDFLVLGVISILGMLIGYGIINTIYAIAFPIKPGDTDVPPLKRAGDKKKH